MREQDTHADYDAGEFGGAMTDAEFYERTAAAPAGTGAHLPPPRPGSVYTADGAYELPQPVTASPESNAGASGDSGTADRTPERNGAS